MSTRIHIEYHYDGDHGWFRIPLYLVRKSGAEISKHSYMDGEFAYLEHDVDITRFVEQFFPYAAPEILAYHFQLRFDVSDCDDGDRSPIRDLTSWSQA